MVKNFSSPQLSPTELGQLKRISEGHAELNVLSKESGQKVAGVLHHFILASQTIRAWEVTVPRGRSLSYTGSVVNGDKPLYEGPHLLSSFESVTENTVWPKEIHDFVSRLPTFSLLTEPQQIVLKNCLLRMLIEQIPLSSLTEKYK